MSAPGKAESGRPWTLHCAEPEHPNAGPHIRINSGSVTVATCPTIGHGGASRETRAANAALIVQAVNERESLLSALAAAREREAGLREALDVAADRFDAIKAGKVRACEPAVARWADEARAALSAPGAMDPKEP